MPSFRTLHVPAKWPAAVTLAVVAVMSAAGVASAANPETIKTVGISEHRFAPSSAPRKQFGEGCTSRGKDGCDSGICLKATKVRGSGHFCSTACMTEEECPVNWLCRELVPGSGGRFCVPPTGWGGAATQVRPDGGTP